MKDALKEGVSFTHINEAGTLNKNHFAPKVQTADKNVNGKVALIPALNRVKRLKVTEMALETRHDSASMDSLSDAHN